MMPLQLFNPWNDLALAANSPHYTPPASAVQMAADLADLSLLWTQRDGLTLSPLQGSEERPPTPFLPWGWSPLQVRLMREAGVEEDFLPTDSQLAEYRAFASRQTAVTLLARFRDLWPEAFRAGQLIGTSTWSESESEVLRAVAAYNNSVMLKAPWSGSGRGVRPVSHELKDKDIAWVRRTLARQGGVEIEPLYNKVQDFAMEFWAKGGKVHFEGLSLFETTAGGVYAGNLVASEEEKELRLSQYIHKDFLQELREHLIILLNNANLPTWYRGPLGIDMMFCRAIHPFVELNLRMTMGWLAILLARRQRPQEVRLFRIIQENGRYRYEINNLSD